MKLVWCDPPGVLVMDVTKRALVDMRKMAARAVDVPGGPNSMNRYGRAIVDTCALVDLRNFVRPFAAEHLGVELEASTRKISAFTVEYDMRTQRRLTRHADSSDVTFNVCLDGDFEGGDLVFYYGSRGRTVHLQQVGGAFIHCGSLEHRAMPLTRGTRRNLVVWFKKAKAAP